MRQTLKHRVREIDGDRHRCPHKNTEKHRAVERGSGRVIGSYRERHSKAGRDICSEAGRKEVIDTHILRKTKTVLHLEYILLQTYPRKVLYF